jgi:hypothetical protein
MEKILTEQFKTPILGEYDVVVCGAGIGGVAAAVAAKRYGVRVLLLEKSIMLGGLATQGLIGWYEPICDGKGNKIMYGMADEIFHLAIAYSANSLPNDWQGNPEVAKTHDRFSSFFSPTILALALDNWVCDAKVDLLLDTLVVAVIMDDNGQCKGVAVENKSGRGLYLAKVIIDATGDADVIYRAGVPCIEGKNYLTCIAYKTDLKKSQMALDSKNILKSRGWLNVGSDLWGNGHPDYFPYLTGVLAEEVTQYVLEGRRLLFSHIINENKWERDITVLPSMAQLRTTRRIKGAYTLSETDEGCPFEDSIGVAGDFAHRGKIYEIPYRTLFNEHFCNLLTVGRSISSSGWAWDVTRVIPVAATTGQAAGIAAAMCAKERVPVKSVNIRHLQRELQDNGVRLHFKITND